MNLQRKLLLLMLMLLLISAGIVVAQTSSSYIVQRSVTLSGGMAGSANYQTHSVIGQPIIRVVCNSSYKVSPGFLYSAPGGSCLEEHLWLPIIVK